MKTSAVLFVIFWSLSVLCGTPATASIAARLALTQPLTASNMSPTPQRTTPRRTGPPSQVLFDDFNYSKQREMTKHGWIIRAIAGWPGVPGATWWPEGVSFLRDPDERGNRILRMISATAGTPSTTRQTQICHQRKYLEGTYAARVRFSDNPISGPGGDQLVESFYTISPLKAPMDPDYSELDWEYLPNGGWGITGPTLYNTTWESFIPEPNWKMDNVSNNTRVGRAGWHTLVTQVGNGKVRYFLDGKQQAEHGEKFYPESLMSINFNLWFIKDGLTKEQAERRYYEDIDWVFHEAGALLTPEEVEAQVASMRRKSIKFQDTVPAPVPALISPCDF
ncbi:MAG: glycoside hydrolase family 16 protein [Pyrinomonadaceae bacterium]